MESPKNVISKFDLPYLPYNMDALEPNISKQTMEVHYNKHHKGYVEKLNKELEDSHLEGISIEDLLKDVMSYSQTIRNNAGGHYNHTLFWRMLSPERIEPYGKLLNQIEAAFESFESFQKQFKKVATSHFGSGWAWLVLNEQSVLEIGSTPNQDNPLMDVSSFSGFPLLGLDRWEHAFYLDYQNQKADYVDAFWNIIDWTEVSKRHEESLLQYNI